MLFLRARWYSFRDGRFVSQDSWPGSIYQPSSLHKYLYVSANPVRYTDPSGHYIFEETPEDPVIWRRDRPDRSLVRGTDRFDFYDWSQSEQHGIFTPLAWMYGSAIIFGLSPCAAYEGAGYLYDIAGLQLLKLALRYPWMARALGLGGTIVAQELADADDNEIHAAKTLGERFADKFSGKPGVDQVLRELEIDGRRAQGAEWQIRYALQNLGPEEVAGFEQVGTVGRVDIVLRQGARIVFVEAKQVNWYALEQLGRSSVRTANIVEQVVGHSLDRNAFSKVVFEVTGGYIPDWVISVLEQEGILVEVFTR